ncbi:unnamed protein product, partial [Clonostachys solani]
PSIPHIASFCNTRTVWICILNGAVAALRAPRPRMFCPRHYSYECKVPAQERPYTSRPSRSQQLRNPKLIPKLTNDALKPLEDKGRQRGLGRERRKNVKTEPFAQTQDTADLPQRTLCPPFQLLLPPILEGSGNMTQIAVQRYHLKVVVWKKGAAVHLKARGPLTEIASHHSVRTQSDLTETETRELPATRNLIKGPNAGGTLKTQSLLRLQIRTLSQDIYQGIVETRAKGTFEVVKILGPGPEEDLTTGTRGATGKMQEKEENEVSAPLASGWR